MVKKVKVVFGLKGKKERFRKKLEEAVREGYEIKGCGLSTGTANTFCVLEKVEKGHSPDISTL